MLEVKIKKRLGAFHLNVDFKAEQGVTGLLGASGCGKSMALKCIAGIVRPDEGRIVLDGRVLFDSEQHIDLPPQQRRVGYLFQNYALFPNMTVEGNIAAGVRGSQKKARVRELIHAFYLEGMEKKRPNQLSGGQQQRVALARILASEPQVLLLDEPFSALDGYLRWQVELELSDLLKTFSGTVLFVSHSRDEVYRQCADVCVLNNGRSESVLPVQQLFDAPTTLAACLLSGCKNISRAKKTAPTKIFAEDWNVTLEAGREVPDTIRHIGVRAHYIVPTYESGENVIPCAVERVVEEVFSTVVMLKTPGGDKGYSRLRIELPKQQWQDLHVTGNLSVAIAPKDILLLTE